MFKKVLAVITVAAAAGVMGVLGLAPLAAQQGVANATRSFDETTVAPGGEVVVTIAAANYGPLGGVTETLPDGFTYVSTSLDAEQVSIGDDGTVRFTLQGDPSFTYTVTASSEAGPYEFSGTLRDSDRTDHAVGGASSITVGDATDAEPTPTPTPSPTPDPNATSAVRSFSPTSVAPGGEVVVTITAANYGPLGGVTETLPEGFTYVTSTLHASQVTNIDDVTVRFTLQGDDSFTYTVTASSEADTYEFSGTLRDDYRNDHMVGGASSITVGDATEPVDTTTTTVPVDTTTTTVPVDMTTTTESVVIQNVRVRAQATRAVVSWDALDGADGYTVQWIRSTRGDPNWDRASEQDASGTSTTVRQLSSGTDYQFRVGATNMDDSWSAPRAASTEGEGDDGASPFATMTPTPTATPAAPPATPIPPTSMVSSSTAATLRSGDGSVTLEFPAGSRSDSYQVNFESETGCTYPGAKADVTFTCVSVLIFDSEDMLETGVELDAPATITFRLTAEQVKALGGEFLLTKLHEMGGLMILTRASAGAGWTAVSGTTLTFDDETGGATLTASVSNFSSFTAVVDQATYDAVQEMYGHLLPRDTLTPPTGGPSLPGVALLALLLGSVALLTAGWVMTARRSGA